MDYAVGLFFDRDSTDRLSSIMTTIVQNGVNAHMLESKIPPHLTLSYFKSEDIMPIVKLLENSSLDWHSGGIFWDSLGVFVPKVLFAAPILNEYLLRLNAEVNSIIGSVAIHDDNGHYLPNRWVPHTALAVGLTESELNVSFEVAARMFTAFGGQSDRLFLAECNPYKEIAAWKLCRTE